MTFTVKGLNLLNKLLKVKQFDPSNVVPLKPVFTRYIVKDI